MTPSVARRPMPGTIRGVGVSVPLVPLLVPELPTLLGLVFAEFGAIPVDVSLALLMVVQAIPFGSFVLPDGIFTPIPCATPAGRVGTVYPRANRGVIHRRWRRIIPWTVATDVDRKVSLGERRRSRKRHQQDQL